ncbi:DUF4179 domain-containing protein [Anaerolentibacter hominis]|uniref:DUF4179 domain-containing protein n=1 Tax=Anaerolentibacter hominis TaxID=3079009 RepID=UPI0031B88DA6
MFQERYKRSYDQIKPDAGLVAGVVRETEGQLRRGRTMRIVKPVVAVFAAALILCTAVPAAAAHIPGFYRAVEQFSPGLADLLIPVNKSCTDQGIRMEVEAIEIEGKRAEVYVSIQDVEGDRISGQADFYDRYGLKSSSGSSVMGGCSFLDYDEATGKAYFKLDVETSGTFDRDKLTFYTYEILSSITEKEMDIPLTGLDDTVRTKQVTLSGGSGTSVKDLFSEETELEGRDDPRPSRGVIDGKELDECDPEGFTITGLAYADQTLRLQICMGEFKHADRHVEPFLVDENGQERYEDASVSWHEEKDGVSYMFYEFYFNGPLEDLENYRLYGIFHELKGNIAGDWEVTFRLEE